MAGFYDFFHLNLCVPVSTESVCMSICAAQAQYMSVYMHNGCT